MFGKSHQIWPSQDHNVDNFVGEGTLLWYSSLPYGGRAVPSVLTIKPEFYRGDAMYTLPTPKRPEPNLTSRYYTISWTDCCSSSAHGTSFKRPAHPPNAWSTTTHERPQVLWGSTKSAGTLYWGQHQMTVVTTTAAAWNTAKVHHLQQICWSALSSVSVH